MRTILIAAAVAAAVTFATRWIIGWRVEQPATQSPEPGRGALASPSGLRLEYTMPLDEDSWIDGTRGAGADHRALAAAESSICFLTKVEIKGDAGPEHSTSCSVDIDDFTGSWEVTATVDEGSEAEVRCNARCLVWK
jgi:hypothetical protein